MKTINELLYLLNKIDLDIYLEYIDDEKSNYIRKVLLDDFADSTLLRTKLILNILDGFVIFFDNINIELPGYW